MQVLIIHDTDSEEIVGMVSPIEEVDFPDFDDEVRRTWSLFNDEGLAEDYSIDSFP